MRRIVLAGVVAAGLFSGVAGAFGPGTHVWLAGESTGSERPAVLYGAAEPDVSDVAFLLCGDGPLHAAFRELTHHEFERVPLDCFGLGFRTHNEEWGADSYAHGYPDPESGDWVDGYVVSRADQLAAETGVSEGTAHAYIELAIDLLLRRDEGPRVGARLIEGALLADRNAGDDLVEAYAAPLAERVEGVSEEQAADFIRFAEKASRVALVIYGSQVAQGERHLMTVIPMAMALFEGTDLATATLRFCRAIQLCEDYRAELDRIAPLIAAELPPM